MAKYHIFDALWDRIAKIQNVSHNAPIFPFFSPTMHQIRDILLFTINLILFSITTDNSISQKISVATFT